MSTAGSKLEGILGKWPLVGRSVELAVIKSTVRAGDASGVILVGPAGIGKTRLAAEWIAVREKNGDAVIRIVGSEALTAIPLGALIPILPTSRSDSADVIHSYREALSVILDLASGSAPILFIDDAHLLDALSLEVVSQLLRNQQLFLMATVRASLDLPDSITNLWKDGLAARIDLKPLSADEVDLLVNRVIGGSLESAASHWLFAVSEGNPLYLRELVVGGLESGALREEDGLWRLQGTPISTRLLELIGGRMKALDELGRETLALIACGEPLPLTLAEAICGSTVLRSLELLGLTATTTDGQRENIRLAHSLYGEAIRARTPPVLMRRIKVTLADSFESEIEKHRDDILRIATWRLETESSMEPAFMLDAARLAHASGDPQLALRLAKATLEADSGFDAELFVAQLSWVLGEAEKAEAMLRKLSAIAADNRQRAAAGCALMDVLSIGFHRIDDARAVGISVTNAIDDPSLRDEVTAHRAQLTMHTGHTREALALVEPVIARGNERVLATAAITAATCLSLSGRFTEALSVIELGRAAQEISGTGELMLGSHIFLDLRSIALCMAGRFIEGEQLARVEYQKTIIDGSDEMRGTLCMDVARALLGRGHALEASRFARESAVLLRGSNPPHLSRAALTMLATALGMAGNPDAAITINELDALGVPATDVLGAEVLQARAWSCVAAGNLPDARELLEDAAAMANYNGDHALEAGALHDLARLGDAKRAAERLAELATVVEGPLMSIRHRHASASMRSDGAAIEKCSDEFGALGADLLAAEAAVSAAVAYARQGSSRKAANAQRKASGWLELCMGAQTPGTSAIQPRVLLTPREQEVATMAARGLSNREISNTLEVSVRTIENQLQRAYEKLGVASRGELATALATEI